ncbi:SAP-like protein [Mya arenaria]|uniref:SAP-like protein n=1 Tax=Mya arenaria TaxID=6604 RepID=A0ABY7DIH4_MYAAR|nr:SAP-like protein [Mya arenaria]
MIRSLLQSAYLIPMVVLQLFFQCQLIAPTIVKELEKGGDPQKTCSDVKLCSADIRPIEQPVGDIKCDICELIINALDKLAGQNATDEKINATIYALCGELPGAAQIFCQNVAPTIVKAIEQGVDPQAACAALKLCSTAVLRPTVQLTKEVGDVKCDICELLVQELEKLIGANATDEKINATIYGLCDQLPGAAASFVRKSRTYHTLIHSHNQYIVVRIKTKFAMILSLLQSAYLIPMVVSQLFFQCQLIAPTIVKELEKGGDPQKTCSDTHLSGQNVINVEGYSWFGFKRVEMPLKRLAEVGPYCVLMLPASERVYRGQDAQGFCAHLLTQIYANSNCDQMIVCSYFNAQIGSLSDLINECDSLP